VRFVVKNTSVEPKMVVRPYNEELGYLEKKSPFKWEIKKGFQPNMKVGVILGFFLRDSFVNRLFVVGGRRVLRQ